MKTRARIKQISDKRLAKNPALKFARSSIAPKPKPAADLTPVGRTYLPTSALPAKRRLDLELVPVGKTWILKSAKPKPKKAAKPIQKSWIKKKPRTPESFDRIYGPAEYQAFTRAHPCACCGFVGATQICHARNGGKSRKADWTLTFPGCGPHWTFGPMASSLNGVGFQIVDGCNTEPERIGKRTFEAKIGKTLLELVAEHQAKYRAHVEAMAGA